MDKLELKNIAVEQGLDFDGVIELVFDAQQAKVEELQSVALRDKQATYAAGFHDGRHGTPCEYLKLQAERDELQKRVDFLEKHLKPCECGSNEISVDQEGYITKLCYRCGGSKTQEMIEQALKGEGNGG